MRFKCRFCCEKSSWFLFGSIHFCLKCYKKFRKFALENPNTPPQHWMSDPMNHQICRPSIEGKKCSVLGHKHKPNPSDKCLGCVTCKKVEKAEKEKLRSSGLISVKDTQQDNWFSSFRNSSSSLF